MVSYNISPYVSAFQKGKNASDAPIIIETRDLTMTVICSQLGESWLYPFCFRINLRPTAPDQWSWKVNCYYSIISNCLGRSVPRCNILCCMKEASDGIQLLQQQAGDEETEAKTGGRSRFWPTVLTQQETIPGQEEGCIWSFMDSCMASSYYSRQGIGKCH